MPAPRAARACASAAAPAGGAGFAAMRWRASSSRSVSSACPGEVDTGSPIRTCAKSLTRSAVPGPAGDPPATVQRLLPLAAAARVGGALATDRRLAEHRHAFEDVQRLGFQHRAEILVLLLQVGRVVDDVLRRVLADDEGEAVDRLLGVVVGLGGV